MRPTVRLSKPIERALRAGHPWIFRDALAGPALPPGQIVTVQDRRGRPLGVGLTDAGTLAVRVFSTEPDRHIDVELLRERVVAALALRARVVPAETTAYRILHGEGDGLPGVVCDRYGDYAVMKLDGEGILALREPVVAVLREQLAGLGVRGLIERSARRHGGSASVVFGETPPDQITVLERGMTLVANLFAGQKTGLFLDHRESRARVRSLARDLCVLNLYGYTGGFSVAAALGGAAEVTTVDVAKPALELAARTLERNGLARVPHHIEARDVPEYLASACASERRFELIVADPPNFAPSARTVERATESYHKLHAACCALLVQGGLYLAASCSSHLRAGAFLDTLREGARRAGRVLTVLEQTGAPADHPRRLAFPEGDYLKVVLAVVA